MGGKRVRKTKQHWGLLGSLVLVTAAVALMVPLTGSADAELPGAEPAPLVTETVPEALPEAAPETETPPQPWGQRLPSVSENDPFWPEEAPWNPVIPLTAAVEDSWFADAAFLGDSRTEGFKLFSGLKEGRYYYGVGATVETVFSRPTWGPKGGKKVPLLDALSKDQPARVYVMLGVNELGWVKSERFIQQYAKVVDRIRADHPEADIILQSILPVSAEQEARHTYVNNGRIGEYNRLIRAMAEEKQCYYLDVGIAVTGEDGCLRPELTPDGVHLNRAGCRIWLEVLKTHTI